MELKLILVDFIPHHQQRYETAGDWQFEQGPMGGKTLHVRVSQTGDDKANALVAVHEIIEALLCLFQGVSEEEVDAYDKAGFMEADDCFSDNQSSPYYDQHNNALALEYLLSQFLGVDWADYESLVDQL